MSSRGTPLRTGHYVASHLVSFHLTPDSCSICMGNYVNIPVEQPLFVDGTAPCRTTITEKELIRPLTACSSGSAGPPAQAHSLSRLKEKQKIVSWIGWWVQDSTFEKKVVFSYRAELYSILNMSHWSTQHAACWHFAEEMARRNAVLQVTHFSSAFCPWLQWLHMRSSFDTSSSCADLIPPWWFIWCTADMLPDRMSYLSRPQCTHPKGQASTPSETEKSPEGNPWACRGCCPGLGEISNPENGQCLWAWLSLMVAPLGWTEFEILSTSNLTLLQYLVLLFYNPHNVHVPNQDGFC